MVWLGCNADSNDGQDDDQDDLPLEEDLPEDDDSTPWETGDDSQGGGTEETPDHQLTLTHTGSWLRTPEGGPWDALSGDLTVVETLDGDLETPTCQALFTVTGTAAEDLCVPCGSAFRVTFSLAEGDPSLCRDPDLPQDGSVWLFGLDSGEETLYLDYADSGVWVPWYPFTEKGDSLLVAWTAQLGMNEPEEE